MQKYEISNKKRDCLKVYLTFGIIFLIISVSMLLSYKTLKYIISDENCVEVSGVVTEINDESDFIIKLDDENTYTLFAQTYENIDIEKIRANVYVNDTVTLISSNQDTGLRYILSITKDGNTLLTKEDGLKTWEDNQSLAINLGITLVICAVLIFVVYLVLLKKQPITVETELLEYLDSSVVKEKEPSFIKLKDFFYNYFYLLAILAITLLGLYKLLGIYSIISAVILIVLLVLCYIYIKNTEKQIDSKVIDYYKQYYSLKTSTDNKFTMRPYEYFFEEEGLKVKIVGNYKKELTIPYDQLKLKAQMSVKENKLITIWMLSSDFNEEKFLNELFDGEIHPDLFCIKVTDIVYSFLKKYNINVEGLDEIMNSIFKEELEEKNEYNSK